MYKQIGQHLFVCTLFAQFHTYYCGLLGNNRDRNYAGIIKSYKKRQL